MTFEMTPEAVRGRHFAKPKDGSATIHEWLARPDGSCDLCELLERLEDSEESRQHAEARQFSAEMALRGKWGIDPMSKILRDMAGKYANLQTFFLEVADALDRRYPEANTPDRRSGSQE